MTDTFGLETYRPNGTRVLTPDMFTVRPADQFQLSGGATSSAIKVPRPKVKAGMFATCSPSQQYTVYDPGKFYGPRPASGIASVITRHLTALTPKITCFDGYVLLQPAIEGSVYTRNLNIHVYENF